MSDEDRAFLEKVMAEGIIDENERMKFILQEATKAMDYYKAKHLGDEDVSDPPISDDDLGDLLQELRDIVEQIDYARAFCSLQGLPFLIGCIEERKAVPEPTRMMCTGILSTLCQNNPPVQKQLLEIGAIKSLSDLFFFEDTAMKMKARIMQAIGSIVRNHEIAESLFCNLPQSQSLFAEGLNPKSSSHQLKSRTLFFFRALITSDTSDKARVTIFENAILCIADYYLEESTSPDLREIAISFLQQLLEQKNGADIILNRRDELAALGVKRISQLRGLNGEEKEFAQYELESWEAFMLLLARAA
jgi:hsp70-interacting protein